MKSLGSHSHPLQAPYDAYNAPKSKYVTVICDAAVANILVAATDIPQVTRGRLLSEAEFDELSSRPYDPSWFDALRLGPQDHMTLLNGFTSKIKIDELIRGGALAAGDIFRADVEVKIAADSDETKYMTMEAEVRSKKNKKSSPIQTNQYIYILKKRATKI